MEETFLAFFKFRFPDNCTEGLCKIAEPQESKNARYISLTLIADSANDKAKTYAESIFKKLSPQAFQKYLPSLSSITATPLGSHKSPSYAHQMDLIFPKAEILKAEEFIPLIAFTLRNSAGCQTDVPEWWKDTLKNTNR